MKILIEGGNLNPVKEGTRNIAISYAKKLLERGHKVIILTRKRNQATGKKYKKFEVVDGFKFYRWSNYLNLFFAYRKIIKKEKVDIFHIFARGARPQKYIQFLKSFKKIPIILSLLGDPFNTRPPKDASKLFEGLDKVLVSSKEITKLPYLNKKNTKYLPYGIDIKKFSEEKVKKDKKTKKILYLRYLYGWDKSPHALRFLDATRKLGLERSIEVILNKKKVGVAPVKNFIDKYPENIRYIGFLEDDEVPKLFNKVDLVVDLHRTDETVSCASPPLLILEAMACGAKVLSSDLPEIREVIKDNKNGFLVKENEIEEIYKKMKQALNSKKNIGKEARKTILKKFDWDLLLPEYEKIYKELLQNKSS